MPVYTFQMLAFADVEAATREEAWAKLAELPDNNWEMDYPELVDEQDDE